MLAAGGLIGCCAFNAPTYRGPRSDHFDGERFINQRPRPQGEQSVLKWILTREHGKWAAWTDAQPGPPPPRRVGSGELRVTFVNHATSLIQMDGVNVLTDPIWSERCSPVSFAGPVRRRPPGLRFEDLPPIDLVVLSHNHYDHMDVPTLLQLERTFRPRFAAGLGNRAFLEGKGLSRVTELDWWQSLPVGNGVEATLVPSQHFSGRGTCDRDGTLWGGYVLRGAGGPVYFSGDTGYGPHFRQVRERFGPMRLALLAIGAFRPAWFMSYVHVSPSEAYQAHLDLAAARSVAIHFGTFELADDSEVEPVQALNEAISAAGDSSGRFWVLGFGEGREVPPLPQ
jgi:L-ascorbate metabolism protein UlaG (beta-lactamase superfamily)